GSRRGARRGSRRGPDRGEGDERKPREPALRGADRRARAARDPGPRAASVPRSRASVSWKPELDEVLRRRELALEHGGSQAVARQHAQGRLTVRERIEAIADPGTFQEWGGITGEAELDAEGRVTSFTPANVVAGVARIGGRPVSIGGDDFTLRGA